MTYIEFFDHISVENICTCLSRVPEKVILLGNSKKAMERHAERYRRIFAAHACDVTVESDNIHVSDVDAAVEKLTELVERERQCVFDITGGDEVLMVAVGILHERYRNNDRGISLSLCRANVKSFSPTAVSDDEEPADPMLTVEENVMIYEGDVVYSDEHPDGTYRWDMNDEFCRDIEVLWSMCKKNLHNWNVQMDMFGTIELVRQPQSTPLCTMASMTAVERELEKEHRSYTHKADLVNTLLSAGYLTEFSRAGDSIRIGYRDEQIKRCLTRAGQALEMKTFLAMRRVTDKRGVPMFSDVVNGVYIDWDGVVQSNPWAVDTTNEIDVMAMRGLVPYFISCKNGKVTAEELYKLQTVAYRFGGTYAKKVLVVNSLKKDAKSDAIRERAEEMGITLIEHVHQMESDEDFYRALRKL